MPLYEIWRQADHKLLALLPGRPAAANLVRSLIAQEGVAALDGLVCDPDDGNPESTLFGCDLLLLLATPAHPARPDPSRLYTKTS